MRTSLFAFVLLSTLLVSSLAFDWRTRFPKSSIDDILHWGTYKSQRIHSITEKTDPLDSLTVSMMIGNNLTSKHPNNLLYNFMDIQPPSNDQTHLNYKNHNGFYYAHQVLDDQYTPVNLTNIFFKTNAVPSRQAWSSLTNIYNTTAPSDGFVTLFYGITLENYHNNGTRYLKFEPEKSQITIMKRNGGMFGEDIAVGYINYFAFLDGNVSPKNIEVHYQSIANLNQSNLWQLNTICNDTLRLNEAGDYLILPNTVDQNVQATTLVLLQFKVPATGDYSLLVTYDSQTPVTNPHWLQIQLLLTDLQVEYAAAFEKTFPNVKKDYKNMAQYALANLIGGMIYYYGPVPITEDPTPQPPLPLFTATPTRNSFQRGFLWDEGFHELLICNWNPDLCLTAISSWFGTQYKTGWIAREQVRGDEIRSFVPGDFVSQSDLEGNPPTLMMALDYLLNNPNVDAGLKNQIYVNLKDPLYKWWSWFYNLQMVLDKEGKPTNFFLWSYKMFEGNRQYFGSGLDDYPRDDPGFVSKYHLDLHVWQAMFANVMAKVATGANDTANATFFNDLSKTLTDKISVFLDPTDNLYKDVFKPNNTDNDTSVPSSHIGYISLLPLMFGYVEENSAGFNATLDLVDYHLPGLVYTQFGISSLSREDTAFQKNSNYWTGPIWVNFNYMLLRAFKLYYWSNARVQDLYNNIRSNIVGTMNNNFANRGYIFEHYNLTTGLGQGNHPFTGWSTTINFILTEQYY